jgi:SAM-dependent methyltransferase
MWNEQLRFVFWLHFARCNSALIPTRSQFLLQGASWWTSSIIGAVVISEEDPSCRNGALISEQAIPGAYSQVCMTQPKRIVPFSSGGDIVIQQEASGSGRTGMAVWNSGLLMTRFIQALTSGAPDWFSQQLSILELGCGTSLVSIACHRLGAPFVLATDGNPDVVRLANTNLKANKLVGETKAAIDAQVLQWGLLNAMDFSETADLVLGADLTYNSGTWRVLAESMEAVLKPNGTVLYLSLGHEGFNVNAEVDGFLSVAKEIGLVPVSEVGGVNVSNLVSSILSPNEKNQLQQSGGARVVALQRKQLKRNS